MPVISAHHRFGAASLPAVFDALFTRWPQGASVRPRSVQQVQHLLYYAQAWHLAYHGFPLFPGRFRAEPWGPFCARAHALFIGEEPACQPTALPEGVLVHLDEVIGAYGDFSDAQLQNMSTNETPWQQAAGGLIDEGCMGQHYASLLPPSTVPQDNLGQSG